MLLRVISKVFVSKDHRYPEDPSLLITSPPYIPSPFTAQKKLVPVYCKSVGGTVMVVDSILDVISRIYMKF